MSWHLPSQKLMTTLCGSLFLRDISKLVGLKGQQCHDSKPKSAGSGQKGILHHFAPLNLTLYGGNLSASSSINLGKKIPQSHMKLFAKNIQLKPLLQCLLEIDFLEGKVNTQFMLRMKWGTHNRIKKTVTGKGGFYFFRVMASGSADLVTEFLISK